MALRTQPIDQETGAVDDACLLTYYGRTAEDWEQEADEQRFVEFIDGRLIVHSPAGLQHQRIFAFVFRLLSEYVERRALGEVLSGPFVMELSLERKFEPDVLFLAEQTRANLARDRLRGPADLAIEIASPSTRGYDCGEKRECYRVGGVREYWMIDPEQRALAIDRPAGHSVSTLSTGAVVSELCPGFWLAAEWLWDGTLPPVAGCLERVLQQT